MAYIKVLQQLIFYRSVSAIESSTPLTFATNNHKTGNSYAWNTYRLFSLQDSTQRHSKERGVK